MSARVLQSGGVSGCCSAVAPRCSVVMPVYNTPEAYLRAAIESILGQSYGDFELLVVDDASAPYVGEVVRSYAPGEARLRYLRQPQQSGAAAARNRALDEARGEFIAFMDADDISLPERLQTQVDYLDAHPEIGCLGSAYRPLRGTRLRPAAALPREHEHIVSYLLFCGCAFCQSSVMLRRCALEQPTPLRYREQYRVAQDCVLWFDLIERTRFANLERALVHYREHEASATARAHSQQVRKMAEAQAELLARYSGQSFASKETWPRLLEGATLSHQEYTELSRQLMQAAEALRTRHGYRAANVKGALRQRLRKAFHRTRSLRGQWELLRLPLRRYARVPLAWCIICLIIKGIL